MIDKKSRGSERSFKERKPKVPENIYIYTYASILKKETEEKKKGKLCLSESEIRKVGRPNRASR